MPTETPLTKNIRPDLAPTDLKAYEANGGYQGVRKALKMAPAEVTDLVKQSNLRGRGGAGFPTGIEVELRPRRKGSSTSEIHRRERR